MYSYIFIVSMSYTALCLPSMAVVSMAVLVKVCISDQELVTGVLGGGRHRCVREGGTRGTEVSSFNFAPVSGVPSFKLALRANKFI